MTPSAFFLSQVLKEESLTTFVERHPPFSILTCEKKLPPFTPPPVTEQQEKKREPRVQLSFPPCTISSFTSLTEKKGYRSGLSKREEEIPAGPEVGTLLHALLEKCDFRSTQEKLASFVAEQVQGTLLESWHQAVAALLWQTFHCPLETLSGKITLATLKPHKMVREMEFLYGRDEGAGYLKGFIDLFFEYEERFYIIDWKSNVLERYDQATLEKAMSDFQYHLQAKIYNQAVTKYLQIFGKEGQFGGIFYLFLRGIEHDSQNGIYFHFNKNL